MKIDLNKLNTRLVYGPVCIGKGNEPIVLAMANSGDYTLGEALAVYGSACERCANALAYKYTNGNDGYPENSEGWNKTNTECQFCKEDHK